MARVLLVDLNNFARYPTISIGLLAAILRKASYEVEVFSPLSKGVTGVIREKPVPPWGLAVDRVNYRIAMTGHPWLKQIRNWVTTTSWHAPKLATQAKKVAEQLRVTLDENQYDVVLVSTYLMHFELCQKIGRLCKERDIPLLLGGPYFAQPEERTVWLGTPGVSGLVGGEVEPVLPELVQAAIERQPLNGFAGVWTTDPHKPNAKPLQNLDRVPFPDYSDFAWDKYPNRIVPMLTGRGCQWGACTFCSDITSSAHRTFRSRSPENVLDELEYQANRCDAELFAFTDLKLNSDLQVWDALLKETQVRVPGARWLGAVHIGATRARNGLSGQDLEAARAAGMVRLTTGLESGSQRTLDRMKKGAKVNVSRQAIRDAAANGISVRVTMIVGYPFETADDLLRTAAVLNEHSSDIERVTLSRFFIRRGTQFHRDLKTHPEQYEGIRETRIDPRFSFFDHEDQTHRDPAYRRGIDEVLRATFRINRKPIRESAREFDGVM